MNLSKNKYHVIEEKSSANDFSDHTGSVSQSNLDNSSNFVSAFDLVESQKKRSISPSFATKENVASINR